MIYAVLRWPFCNWPPNVVFFHLQFNTWMQNLKSVCVKLVKEPNLFFISKYHYDIWGNYLKIERCPLFIKYSSTKNQSLCWDYYCSEYQHRVRYSNNTEFTIVYFNYYMDQLLPRPRRNRTYFPVAIFPGTIPQLTAM